MSYHIILSGKEQATDHWPSLSVCTWLFVCRWVWVIWMFQVHAQLISVGLAPPGSTFPAPPHCRFPLSCWLSLLNTERLISSDWQPCSHLALQSWCPRVSASRKAIVEVPLWLSLSFSQYPAPADRGWKVPTAALNYELHSVSAIYTAQHREPFPAEMPLAADYRGNISCTATRVVMVRRQSTWRSFCLRINDCHERRGTGSWWNCSFLSHSG